MDASGPVIDLHRETRMKKQIRVLRIINISYLIAIAILGLVLVFVAAWMIAANLWLCPILNLVYITAWLAMAIGLGNFVLAIIGGVLLYTGQTRGTFQPFMICTSILMVGLIVVLILSIKAGNDVHQAEYATSLFDLFVEAKTEFRVVDFGRDAFTCWQRLQRKYQCCGGMNPNDWLNSRNVSANHSAPLDQFFEAPSSCHCPAATSPQEAKRLDASCVKVVSTTGLILSVFRVGCIHKIIPLASEHMTVLKIITPCIGIFVACHVGLALFLAIRSKRLSAVDVYSMAIVGSGSQSQDGDAEDRGNFGNSHNPSFNHHNYNHRLRRNRFAAEVSGVAPFALELETTQGCT